MTGAGDLSTRISIEKPQYGDDGAGGTPITWALHATVWAKTKPLRASETERQGAMRNVNITMFTVRRRLDLLEDMRIVWAGENFNIREIRRPESAAQFMDIIAEQGVTQ